MIAGFQRISGVEAAETGESDAQGKRNAREIGQSA